MKKIETWLPLFSGFYETEFDCNHLINQELHEINSQRKKNKRLALQYDEIEFHIDDYENRVGKFCCEFLADNMSEFVSGIEFQKIKSPKYYNFKNDSIDCVISISKENIKQIQKSLTDYIEDFKDYLNQEYTSCDGFTSFYSNDVNDWLFDPDLLNDSHKLGAVLNFLLLYVKEMDQYVLYDFFTYSDENYISLKENDFDYYVNAKCEAEIKREEQNKETERFYVMLGSFIKRLPRIGLFESYGQNNNQLSFKF